MTDKEKGGFAIVPLNEVGKRAGVDATFMKGAAWALGMRFHEIGGAFCLSDADTDRLVEMYTARKAPVRERRTRAVHT